jgi:hypothetical protein
MPTLHLNVCMLDDSSLESLLFMSQPCNNAARLTLTRWLVTDFDREHQMVTEA